MNGYIGGMGK